MKQREPYESDLSDAEWRILEPILPPPAKEGRPRKYDLREIINAIFYQSKTGCHWRMLPHDLPPWRSVHYYFRKWRDDGTRGRIHDQLRSQLRRQMGRHREPSIAIIDSQTVKTSEKGGRAAQTLVRS